MEIWEDHSTWETAWRVRTDGGHYEIRRLGSYIEAKQTSRLLEDAFARFETVLDLEVDPSRLPLKVWILPDLTKYREFGEEHGENHSSFFGSFYAGGHPERVLATYSDSNWGRIWLIHSALHQFLDACFPGRERPLWLEEGLAAYFSTCDFGNFNWAKEQFYAMRQDDSKFIPLEKLVSDGIEAYGEGNPTLRMIELGMVFSYLLDFRDDTRTRRPEYAPFRDYIKLTLQGADTTGTAVHDVIGTAAARADLERELRTERFENL